MSLYKSFGKRALDLALGSVASVVAAPVVALAAGVYFVQARFDTKAGSSRYIRGRVVVLR